MEFLKISERGRCRRVNSLPKSPEEALTHNIPREIFFHMRHRLDTAFGNPEAIMAYWAKDGQYYTLERDPRERLMARHQVAQKT